MTDYSGSPLNYDMLGFYHLLHNFEECKAEARGDDDACAHLLGLRCVSDPQLLEALRAFCRSIEAADAVEAAALRAWNRPPTP